ncbi:MAG: tRNA threonylcarbamoyladenosine dehydratase [Lachnospiraceae bacterium]|nr:tRNA threonylcarbamoyladenosine dehydratase [Lachnospiraceae bacterium]
MINQFSRTELLLGREAMEKLFHARVAVFGLGGVGGYTVEALSRSGIGTLDLIDDDKICLTNLNRQIYALQNTIGKYKVDVAEERILQINPEARVNKYKTFYMPETAAQFDFSQYDYVVDAIDTVTGKIALVEQAEAAGTPIISCMGAGNKMDASALEVADIYETSICPLARVMRRELKKRGIKKLKVVYSREPAMTPVGDGEEDGTESCCAQEDCPPEIDTNHTKRRQVPGSNAFVPAVAGLMIAGEVVRDLSRVVTGCSVSAVPRHILPACV